MESYRIILGLGNPGPAYRRTRHNIGFRVVERLAATNGVSMAAAGALRSRAWTGEWNSASGKLVVAKPRTYMNRSGRAAAALCRHYEVPPESLLVVFDDADLQLGRLRIRRGGGAGGHNGIRSLIEVLGTDAFARLKLGVRGVDRDAEELADYVLEPFDDAEEPVVEEVVDLAVEAIGAILTDGLNEAMNQYNGRSVGLPADGS